MNRLEILAMEAGEELNILVVKEIIGGVGDKYPTVLSPTPPKYSTDWTAIKEVVDKMTEDSFSLELIIGADGNTLAHFFDASQTIPDDRSNQIICESVPEAICKAALLTKAV